MVNEVTDLPGLIILCNVASDAIKVGQGQSPIALIPTGGGTNPYSNTIFSLAARAAAWTSAR
jgi:hypothetical protein